MAAVQRTGSNYSTWWGADVGVDEHGHESGNTSTDSANSETALNPLTQAPPSAGTKRIAENSGQRTSARAAAPCVETGSTSSGDSVYAAASAIKGRDAVSGIEIEVFSVSVQAGGQFEAQLGAARLGASSDDGARSIEMDVFTARAAMGVHNADGSFGWNAGATATAIGAEGTLQLGTASSVTAGASIGVGFEGSIGLRDADGDHEPELCGRAVVGWVTLGLCVEAPFAAPALAPTPRTAGNDK